MIEQGLVDLASQTIFELLLSLKARSAKLSLGLLKLDVQLGDLSLESPQGAVVDLLAILGKRLESVLFLLKALLQVFDLIRIGLELVRYLLGAVLDDAVQSDLLLDLLGPLAKKERLHTLVPVVGPLLDGANDGRLAVAGQARLQDPRELGVTEVDVASGGVS